MSARARGNGRGPFPLTESQAVATLSIDSNLESNPTPMVIHAVLDALEADLKRVIRQLSQPQQHNNPSPPTPTLEKTQTKIFLAKLLHSTECRKSSTIQTRQRSAELQNCVQKHSYCPAIKNLLNHTDKCTAGSKCSYDRCWASRRLLIHYKYCEWMRCPLCMQIKQMGANSVSSKSS